MTGQRARRTTSSATLPNNRCFSQERPCVPITIRSQPSLSRISRTCPARGACADSGVPEQWARGPTVWWGWPCRQTATVNARGVPAVVTCPRVGQRATRAALRPLAPPGTGPGPAGDPTPRIRAGTPRRGACRPRSPDARPGPWRPPPECCESGNFIRWSRGRGFDSVHLEKIGYKLLGVAQPASVGLESNAKPNRANPGDTENGYL